MKITTLFFLAIFVIDAFPAESPAEWPDLSSLHKPWTRWWWHGNAVDSLEIQRHLIEFSRVGIGGVEVTSIYGVHGQEHNVIPYLSDRYLAVLDYTAQQAQNLGLGVDIPPGSGWRCGGFDLSLENADARVVIEKDTVAAGETYHKVCKKMPHALTAFSENKKKLDLTPFIVDSAVTWQPESGSWIVYDVSQKWTGAKVKRAAPGGEGYSFNPYSITSTEQMLRPFTAAFEKIDRKNIRCIFHDSFEYSGDWTEDFFSEFANRRGYDLRDYLPELTGIGDMEIIRRVKCDYRETISDLVRLEFLLPLQDWAHARGWLLRNQSHGSPAHLLDLYGAVDIPETEIFRFDHDPRVLKFASSAANVMGKPLVSAESFTWQDEHFTVTLDTMKRSADLLFASGINHLFFHGTAYSPQQAEWPGWLFYASSQINPQNTIWTDLPAFNSYITHCQSLLQTSSPDNDVLVYWPVYDVWSNPDGLNKQLAIHHPQWISENPAGDIAQKLTNLGISYDFVSDNQLKAATVQNEQIAFSQTRYKTVIIPECEFLPVETLKILLELAQSGATIVLEKQWPAKVPGLNAWHMRQKVYAETLVSLHPGENRICQWGNGRIVYSESLQRTFDMLNIKGEPIADVPKFLWLRKKHTSGHLYFLANHSEDKIEKWLTFARPFVSAVIFDPLSGQTGSAQIRGDSLVYLQLDAGQSLFLKTYNDAVSAPDWFYRQASGESRPLSGTWKIDFVSGGPELPPSFTQDQLTSWTREPNPDYARFAGTARYTITFAAPVKKSLYYKLDLGRLAESAHIVLNGQKIGTRFARPYTVNIELQPLANELEIYVTNLAANRIRDLDQRGVAWRIFHDINFVNIDYQPFDASSWPIRESGLLGPVTLTPLAKMEF